MDSMNPFDIVVLAILVLSVFWGGMRGVISQIATIASWGLSWLISARYYTVFATFLPSSETGNTIVAPIVVFVVSAIAIGIAFRFFKRMVSLAGLKEFDRQAGALFGALKGALLCLLITFFAVIVSDKTRDFVNNSKSGPFFVSLIGQVQSFFPESKLKDKFVEISVLNKEEREQSNSLEAQVDSLKDYLKTRVLSQNAAEIVEEVESEATDDNIRTNRSFSSFISNMKKVPNLVRSVAQDGSTFEEARNKIASWGTSEVSDRSFTAIEEFEESMSKDSSSYDSSEASRRVDAFDSFVTSATRLGSANSGFDSELLEDYDRRRANEADYSNATVYPGGGDDYSREDGRFLSTLSSLEVQGINSTRGSDGSLSDGDMTVFQSSENSRGNSEGRAVASRNRRRHSRTASSIRLRSYQYSPSGTDY